VNNTRLVADVGGTNSRIGLFDETEQTIDNIVEYRNADFDCLEDVITRWLEELAAPAPTRGCIAAAAPPSGDQVNMINLGWSFSCRELATRFGLDQFLWLNDFQANAHALPYLGSDDLEPICTGNPGESRILATVGPGTGLGGATLHWIEGTYVASDSEPGHVGLSPATELEIEIFRLLLPDHGDIYAELLVSGTGLTRLYQAIARINGIKPEELSPPEVSQRAVNGQDPLCVATLETFCALLGSACGDFILSNGAYGGLYIAGGIIPRMTDFLRRSEFLPRLRAKGAMRRHLKSVPVSIITEPYPGLIGAAHAPIQES
jgi:glucokinase